MWNVRVSGQRVTSSSGMVQTIGTTIGTDTVVTFTPQGGKERARRLTNRSVQYDKSRLGIVTIIIILEKGTLVHENGGVGSRVVVGGGGLVVGHVLRRAQPSELLTRNQA